MIRALAVALLLSGCAVPDCFAPEKELSVYQDNVLSANAGIAYNELTDAERRNYLHALNTIPPQTGLMYERIGFFSHENSPLVLVVHVENCCVWGDGMMKRTVFFGAAQRGGT